jgi:glycosyltransferase involved in cell wall biosynthesis
LSDLKKILIVANNDAWVYKLRKEIIINLIEKGYNVVISVPIGDSIELLKEMGCEIEPSPLERRSMNPFADINLFFHYIKLLKKVKPNIVLSYTIKPNIYASLACRLMKIPYINNITGLGSAFGKKNFLENILVFLYRISLKGSSCVFFQNKEDEAMMIRNNIVKQNYALIPGSGVNLKEYEYKLFPSETQITFIFIGRIMKDKGIDQFLEAAKKISHKNKNTRFLIIGFIEKSQPYYKELIQQYEKGGYIEYLGYQNNVKAFIEQSHCIIQPSHGGEGISNVLLETAATGRALIASNIPGCRETINEGINGYTFEPQNTDSLVEQIQKFINLTHQEKIIMGKNSRVLVENIFNRDFVVKAYMEKIKEIVK